MTRADVVIVGGGPAGASAAILLARRGYDVALLDRARFPRSKVCGEFVNPAACALLAGVLDIDPQELHGAKVSQVRIQLGAENFLQIPIVDASGTSTHGISASRVCLDLCLIDGARAAGACVFEGFNVRSLSEEADGVTVMGTHRGGSDFRIRARLVLAADGTHSVVARRADLTIPDRKRPSIGISVRLTGIREGLFPAESVWMFPSTGDGMMFGISRQPQDSAVLAGSVPARFARELAQDPALFIRAWIHSHPDLERDLGAEVEIADIRTTACFGHRLLRTFGPRMLLLGDAARFVDPFTGEGIYHALEGAVLAADVTDQALQKGRFDAAFLSRYEFARAEMRGRYSLCRLVREVCLRPRLVGAMGKRLRTRPALAQTLVGAIVDTLPSGAVLDPRFLLRALAF